MSNFEQTASGKPLRVAKFFAELQIAVIRALELRFQPAFLDMLPLYIVLLAGFLLVCTGLCAQDQQQSSGFAVPDPQVSLRSLPQHFSTEMEAETVTASGCSAREFFHQTRIF